MHKPVVFFFYFSLTSPCRALSLGSEHDATRICCWAPAPRIPAIDRYLLQAPALSSKPAARHDTDMTVFPCIVVWTESARQPDRCVLCLVSGGVMAGSAGRTPTQNALVRRSIHTATPVIRHDKTAAPASRPPPRRRPDRQVRLVARPPTRNDVVRHAQCKPRLWSYDLMALYKSVYYYYFFKPR